ncbi:MAG: tRNA (cytidine(34)-2'-O)-methyltransferase [Verrucomicrobiota bacterium]
MFHIVLFEPEIPPNTGNIGRLCHATDMALHLIEPIGFSLDDKSLKRAGLDYWHELSPTVWESWDIFTEAHPASDRYFYLSTKADKLYWDAEFRDGDYLIFGPETRGLPETLLADNASQALRIPQTKGRSLNLSTSVGITLYEAMRQVRG